MLRLGEPRWVALAGRRGGARPWTASTSSTPCCRSGCSCCCCATALLAAAGSAEQRSATRRALALAAAPACCSVWRRRCAATACSRSPSSCSRCRSARRTAGVRGSSPDRGRRRRSGDHPRLRAVQYRETDYWGLTAGHGWALYGRAAPFADCRAFTPPAGTRRLCESNDARVRFGPQYYFWNSSSPAFLLFPRRADERRRGPRELRTRGDPRAAQGLPAAVGRILASYVFADAGSASAGIRHPAGVAGHPRPRPLWEEFNRKAVDPLYRPRPIRLRGLVQQLGEIQAVVRVRRRPDPAATILTLVGAPAQGPTAG